MAIIDASRKKEDRDKRFIAAINGIDLDASSEANMQDIAEVNGRQAREEGFGVNEGIGVLNWGDDEWQE